MKDVIIGIHGIKAAIENPERTGKSLYFTSEGKKEFSPLIAKLDGSAYEVGPHELQERAKDLFEEGGFQYSRVPSGAFLICDPLKQYDSSWIFETLLMKDSFKILCLDSITDVYNGAAIMRTAAFYGVDAIVVATRGHFGVSPGFSRIASGAIEYIKIVKVSSLPKFLAKIQKQGVCCVGLSEHESEALPERLDSLMACLVLGAEETGISNAVSRILNHQFALKGVGKIRSLNVSVAAALAMDRVFTNPAS